MNSVFHRDHQLLFERLSDHKDKIFVPERIRRLDRTNLGLESLHTDVSFDENIRKTVSIARDHVLSFDDIDSQVPQLRRDVDFGSNVEDTFSVNRS